MLSWRYLPLALSIALVLGYPRPPATDWPQHTAAAGLLVALVQHDPCVTAHYRFNLLQPVPYHLAYVALVPAVGAFGVRWGGAWVLAALAALTSHAMGALARAAGRRRADVVIAAPLVFFSGNFAWGFAPTMVGLPFALYALARLLRGLEATSQDERKRHAIWAGTFGALATSAHVVYAPCLPLAAGAAWWLRREGQNTKRSRVGGDLGWLLASSALATAPAGALIGQAVAAAFDAASGVEVRFESLHSGGNHLRLMLAPFDRSFARAGHYSAVATALGAAMWWTRRQAPHAKLLWACTLTYLALVWGVPVEMALRPTPAWLLNVRYVPLAEACLFVAASPPRHSVGRVAPWGKLAASLLFVFGVARLFHAFNADTACVESLARDLPPGATSPAPPGVRRYRDAWPPLERHVLSGLVPWPVCRSEDLFVGGQLPIAPTNFPAPRSPEKVLVQ